jgi:nucleotidyltransferase substrate binding protein (TIGR01987 family)
MSETDVRWEQRLKNFDQAFSQLSAAVALSQQRALSDLEKQGLIQAFEFTHELAWNVIKDYFAYQGNSSITGSRDAAREAFQKGLIKDGEIWMEMIRSRNQTTHTYNEAVSSQIVAKITNHYFVSFRDFQQTMKTLLKE